jgi:hypothetical protein
MVANCKPVRKEDIKMMRGKENIKLNEVTKVLVIAWSNCHHGLKKAANGNSLFLPQGVDMQSFNQVTTSDESCNDFKCHLANILAKEAQDAEAKRDVEEVIATGIK